MLSDTAYQAAAGALDEIRRAWAGPDEQPSGIQLYSAQQPPLPPVQFGIGIGVRSDRPRIELRLVDDTFDPKQVRQARSIAKKQGFGARVLQLYGLSLGRKSTARPNAAGNPLQMIQRPLCIGASVGRMEGVTGSIGAFVERDGKPCLLSCSHVLTIYSNKEANKPGTEIYQAWEPTALQPAPDHQVAALTRAFTLPSTSQSNRIDVALAELDLPTQLLTGCPNAFPPDSGDQGTGRLQACVPARLGMVVAKFGRTTGYRTGRISALAMQITLQNGPRKLTYEDLIEVQSPIDQPFSQPGDSGAVVFEQRTGACIGLIMAGEFAQRPASDDEVQPQAVHVTYICRLDSALAQFNAKLIL
jgi:hypothetical protein